jgi:hypothetical protein
LIDFEQKNVGFGQAEAARGGVRPNTLCHEARRPDGWIRPAKREQTARKPEKSTDFLGKNVRCAQCHDHEIDKWKQKCFYFLA